MQVKRYICRTCGKTYQKLGWLKRHIAKFQHSPVWVNLVDKRTIESRLSELEKQVHEILDIKFIVPADGMDPIKRIKLDTYRPERNANKVNFAKVVNDAEGLPVHLHIGDQEQLAADVVERQNRVE
ncbi:MAG: hypothetical protein ACFFDF_22570, partial [Candidatus Odinarchaeota archaeon]